MSRRQRRGVDIFNLSFLDVVSCGFGAIILLLVIVKIAEPQVIEKLAVDLSGLVQRLQAELHHLQGETETISHELMSNEEQLSESRQNLARLRGGNRYPEAGASPRSVIAAHFQAGSRFAAGHRARACLRQTGLE